MSTPRKDATRGEFATKVLTVQDAITLAVHHTTECPPKLLADRMGRSHRYILDVGDEFRDAKLKAEEVAPFVIGTGSLTLLQVIARECGCAVYELPEVDATSTDALQGCAKVLKETADVASAIANAAKDGVYTPAEAERIRREGEQAIAAVLAAVACVESQVRR
jgi:hypothetical protein